MSRDSRRRTASSPPSPERHLASRCSPARPLLSSWPRTLNASRRWTPVAAPDPPADSDIPQLWFWVRLSLLRVSPFTPSSTFSLSLCVCCHLIFAVRFLPPPRQSKRAVCPALSVSPSESVCCCFCSLSSLLPRSPTLFHCVNSHRPLLTLDSKHGMKLWLVCCLKKSSLPFTLHSFLCLSLSSPSSSPSLLQLHTLSRSILWVLDK